MDITEEICADAARLRRLTGVEFYLQTGPNGYQLMRPLPKGGANPATGWRRRTAMRDFLNDMINIIEKSQEANKLHMWWRLDTDEGIELTDVDKEHIAKMIKEGCTEGEVIHDD